MKMQKVSWMYKQAKPGQAIGMLSYTLKIE